MALLFMDGFDKYGGANTNATSVAALLAGEWTTITNANIAAPLSSTGQALIGSNLGGITKTLASSVGRIIGGVRFSTTLTNNTGVQFLDGASNQCGIQIPTTGVITFRNGSYTAGTSIGSGGSISASTTHYLEWDITLGNSAAYNIYLDGVSLFSGTGDTTATANNTINGVQLAYSGASVGTFDDFYLFDTTGSTNNAVLLTSPRIETTFPTGDNAVQFGIGAATLGNSVARTGSNFSPGAANTIYLRAYTPTRNCTLASISFVPNVTNGTVNLRPVVYADVSGTPNGGTLLGSGATVTGVTAGVIVTAALTSPPSLTAGTQYWLGLMIDTNAGGVFVLQDSSAVGRTAGSVTFTSGAPSTCPTTTGGASTSVVYGNITGTGVNYYEVGTMPPQGLQSYLFDATVAHEDLFNFANLSAIPANIYAVAVKANCARSDAGARTVSMRMSSGGTDGGGSATGQTPGTSFAWLTTLFETDPNGSIPWTGVNLNAAQTGFKVDA